ncbi:Phosphoribosylaminoimidazole carboxylase [Ramaria rubella]|nr:Phosphoribosylaminoimidazole carboxylase [Ramaria rubella]
MLAASASLLNIPLSILDVGANAPAKQVTVPQPPLTHVDGSFTSPSAIRELAAKVDILTVEIEHVNVDVLEEVQKETGIEVHPSPETLRIVQDKFRQKEHLARHGIPVVEYVAVKRSVEGVKAAVEQLGLPLMLKSRTLAYDGRGNYVLDYAHVSLMAQALEMLGDRPLYAEKWVLFHKEVAVIVVRTKDSKVRSYPAVETVQKDNICHLVFAPLRAPGDQAQRAQKLAEDAVRTFSGAGVFGVEMFLLENGDIIINEIAPRPHNSGHYTIEACHTSQYENHLRAVLSLPLGSTSLIAPSAAMLNLIGFSSSISEVLAVTQKALDIPGAHVHLYGKSECRKGRKMGHVTLVADSDAQCRDRLRLLLEALPASSSSSSRAHPSDIELYTPIPVSPSHSHESPLVSVIMGSDSDLPVMLPTSTILTRLQVPHELTIVSAHRTPDRMVKFAREARARGVRVIVAGAGGAAHLPGMVAALTPLPVVGVPVKGSSLDGVDSLHSIVQMPRGIPVATVAINNGLNAGLLAARILSTGIPELADRMETYMREMEEEVMGKVARLGEEGWEKYVVKR